MIISTKSPFYIRTNTSTVSRLEYKLYIYDGSEANFNASDLEIELEADDLFDYPNYTVNLSDLLFGFIDEQSFFRRYRFEVDRYSLNGNFQGQDVFNGFFGDGYYYYNESNSDIDSLLMQDNVTIYKPFDENIRLPYNTTKIDYAVVTNKGKLVAKINNLNQGTEQSINSANLIAYLNPNLSSYEKRVSDDGGIYENNNCSVAFLDFDETPYDSIELFDLNGDSVKVRIEPTPYCLYGFSKCTFLNKFGVEQDFYFANKRKEKASFKSKSFKNSLIDENSSVLDFTNKPNFSVINNNSRTTIEVNTGYINEDNNEVIKQILNSSSIFLDGKPVLAQTRSLDYKKRINDGLIDYKLTFINAFNDINDIY